MGKYAAMLRKAAKRIWRILTFRKGVYGTLGRQNRFDRPVFLHEKTQVGNFNYFGPYFMSLNASVGNFCTFGPGTKIGQSQHDITYYSAYPSICQRNTGYDMTRKKTVIENDVWTGANVVIMGGVTVGTGAVIGANAVVTHDVPPYAIAVGVPAKIIRCRFDPETIDCLLDSRWFDSKTLEEATRRVDALWKARQPEKRE